MPTLCPAGLWGRSTSVRGQPPGALPVRATFTVIFILEIRALIREAQEDVPKNTPTHSHTAEEASPI